jgi:hypothetical protein
VKSHEWLHKLAEPEPAKAALALQRLEEGKPVRVKLHDGVVIFRKGDNDQYFTEALGLRVPVARETIELLLYYLDAVFQSWRIELDDEQ